MYVFFQDQGGGRFGHFFMFLGPPKKQGRCVTAWTTFGHKILLSQTAMSLQSLSLVGTLNEFCLLKSCLQSVFSATAKKRTLPRQATVLVLPSSSFSVPLVPPPGPTSCTYRPRHDDGDRRVTGRKRKSFRTRTVQMHHQRRPRPKSSSFLVRLSGGGHVWLSHRRPILLSPRAFFSGPGGGADLAILAHSWVRKKTGVNASPSGQLLDIKYYCPKP